MHLLHVSQATRAMYAVTFYGNGVFLFRHTMEDEIQHTIFGMHLWTQTLSPAHKNLVKEIIVHDVNDIKATPLINQPALPYQQFQDWMAAQGGIKFLFNTEYIRKDMESALAEKTFFQSGCRYECVAQVSTFNLFETGVETNTLAEVGRHWESAAAECVGSSTSDTHIAGLSSHCMLESLEGEPRLQVKQHFMFAERCG